MLWQVEQYPIEANVAPRATTSALKLEGSGVATSGIVGRQAKAANPSKPTTPAPVANKAHRRSVRPFIREVNEAAFDTFVSIANSSRERFEQPQSRLRIRYFTAHATAHYQRHECQIPDNLGQVFRNQIDGLNRRLFGIFG